MNKGSKYKSEERPTFKIWDNEKDEWYHPTFEAYRGEVEELLLSPGGDLSMRTLHGITHESLFPERFEVVLDEPQKVKVPLFVAKWIPKCRELNWTLPDLLAPEAFESSFARNTEEWLRQDKQNYDILARAWLDGYEVEEEPKFLVPVPNLTKEFFYTIDGEHISFCQRNSIDSVKSKVKFTKTEVEKMFPDLANTVEKV